LEIGCDLGCGVRAWAIPGFRQIVSNRISKIALFKSIAPLSKTDSIL
jgi:hypothetical protein